MRTKENIHIIVAVSENNVIGKENRLPWKQTEDLKNFKKVTSGHIIIMGRNTLESFGGRLLPDRIHIVLSANPKYVPPEGCILAKNMGEAIYFASQYKQKKIFFIGGTSVFEHAFSYAKYLHVTHIEAEVEGDCFLDIKKEIKWNWKVSHTERVVKVPADEKNQYNSRMVTYERD